MSLAIGDKAPAFQLQNQSGKKISLKDHTGKRVILFFYPEDDTPLCTEEVCNLRENFSSFKKKGIVVLGVSPDNTTKHDHFHSKQSLPYDLLSDTKLEVMTKYGVWAEKIMFGRRYMGVKRMTFLINEKGIIVHIIAKVIAKKATDQIRKVWTDLE